MAGDLGMITGLGLDSRTAPAGEVAASFRGGWLRHFKLALSSAGGAAIMFGLFDLLQREPAEGFKLLGQWGPWPVIALVALVLVGGFMSRMNETVQNSFGAVVSSVQQSAQASGKTAEALSRLADQGGRQGEEVRRLAIYAGRELGVISERLDAQDTVMADLVASVRGLHRRLDESKSKSEMERR
jgi:hypothetical protein